LLLLGDEQRLVRRATQLFVVVLNGPRAAAYEGEQFRLFRELMASYEPERPERLEADYFQRLEPEELLYDQGIYAQDQWTIKRLTVNAGLRYEWVNAQVPVQDSPAGRFVAARHFDAVTNVPKQHDPAPRFGVAYDLFGNGKTALKYSLNRYNASRTTGDANSGAQRCRSSLRALWKGPRIRRSNRSCVSSA